MYLFYFHVIEVICLLCINFALTEISCQTSVYSLITFFMRKKKKRGKRNNSKSGMEKLQQVCSISTDWGWFQEQGLKII